MCLSVLLSCLTNCCLNVKIIDHYVKHCRGGIHLNYGMIATGNHCNSDSLRGAPLPAVKRSDYLRVSAKTYCVTGAMNGSPTVRTKCIWNLQTTIYRFAELSRYARNIIIVVKWQDNIFKKTGLRRIIVNCQLSIVNSAKPFKHQFVAWFGFPYFISRLGVRQGWQAAKMGIL